MNWKRILIAALLGATVGCLLFTHRRVIRALICGEEMPEAPWWHFWCR